MKEIKDMTNTIVTKEKEQICINRLTNAIQQMNAKKNTVVKIAVPELHKWGFSITKNNETAWLTAEYMNKNNTHGIEWKSSNSMMTKAFQKKVEKYVNILLFKTLGLI